MNPSLRRRRSIRMPGCDYSQAGYYFVTICAYEHECLFGEIQDDCMALSEPGRAVEVVWAELPRRFPSIDLDAFVVMPNHVHGIVVLVDRPVLTVSPVGAGLALPSPEGRASPAPTNRMVSSKARRGATLGAIVGAFKSLATLEVNHLLSRSGRPLWQRNYYEHIIRDDAELQRIRQYIADNPAKWAEDHENPLFRRRDR